MVSQYLRGRRIEYDVKKKLEGLGYIVTRASGSHTAFDLIASSRNCVRFVQCKYTKSKNNFVKEKKQLEETARICVPCGCFVELWVKRKSKRKFEIDIFDSNGKCSIER